MDDYSRERAMNSEPDEQISDDELRRNYRSVVSGLTTRIRK
jgi:hypothetical protein